MSEESEIKVLYRYEMFHFGETASLNLIEHEVLRRTPKGFWIFLSYNREKWVAENARNKFAHKTKHGALKGYVRRKTYRNHCIAAEMERNEETIIEAKRLLRKNDKQGEKQIAKGSGRLTNSGRIR